MKNTFFLMVFSLFLLMGCSKDELNTGTPGAMDHQQIGQLSDVRLISFSGNAPVVVLSSQDLQNTNLPSAFMVSPRTANHHLNGHFSPFLDPNEVDVTLSAMENNGGIHGNGQVKSWFLDFNMSTECLTVVGNEAIYGGVITQVNYVDPAWADEWCTTICIDPGVHFVAKVVDNGEGQNNPPDQTAMFFAIGPVPLCDFFPVDSPYWSWQMIDVQGQGDQIQVE
jgi:hypothetical protein